MKGKMSDNLSVPNNPAAEEFRKSHWGIDSGIESGQVKAGEVDKEQVEFLKNTTFINDSEK